MKQLQFEQDIKAPVQQVYRTMLGLDNIETYELWTKIFNPTSTYRGNWEKGSKMYFIGTDDEGNPGGMVSEVEEHIPAQYVAVRHYGMLQGDQVVTEGPEVEQWAGGVESYSFEEEEGVTTVTIETEVTEEYLDFFKQTYPRALYKLKELIENKS